MLRVVILAILFFNSLLKGNFIDDRIMFIGSDNNIEIPSLFRSSCLDRDFQQVKVWEVKVAVAGIITRHAEIANHDTCDAMVLHWLSGILIQAQEVDEAIASWRRLTQDKAHTVPIKYHAIFEIADTKIADLFSLTRSYLQQCELQVVQDIRLRQAAKWGQLDNDRTQFDGIPTQRSFNNVNQTGIRITALQEYIPLMQEALAMHPNKPLLDILKNKRILTVNGLTDSKVSYTMHDLFDHFWLYNKVEKCGFFTRYADFFKNLGNPHHRDIFSREGELIASIGFEYRLFLESHDYAPLFTINDIKAVLSLLNTENQKNAYNLLLTEFTDSAKAHILTTVYSGIMIELMEQRRKNGFIKIYDHGIVKSMESCDPEYTALIVEVCSLLGKLNSNTHKILLNIALLTEEYFRNVASKINEGFLTVTMNSIETFDPIKSTLEPELIAWYKKHLGFAATRKILSMNEAEK